MTSSQVPVPDPLPPRLARLAEVLPPSACVDAAGHLQIGGCDLVELARTHGTPLFVYDEAAIEHRCDEFTLAFAEAPGRLEGRIAYASKAFSCPALLRIVAARGLWLDVSTDGELAVALAAGFPPERIVLHGNNKARGELEAARKAGVARVVVDSFDDIDNLSSVVAADGGPPQQVFVRLTPGVDADTHEYIRTGHEESKFGLGWSNGQALEAVKLLTERSATDLTGVHCHIGSQIFDLDGFREAARALVQFAVEASAIAGHPVCELDLGGGLGIAYTEGERPVSVAEWITTLTGVVAEAAAAGGLADPVVYVEPGRALVGRAGVTLYTVGTIKHIPGVRTYVAVDGGMSDNPRPALYGAAYETILADRPQAARDLVADLAGKHCESSDVLATDTRLPVDVRAGDVLVTPATGAYGYSMASNYNLVGRPGVVFVRDGEARVVIRREGIDDVMRLML
ncbi:MAG: diaminopimelate decarboxylase [Acidimicrobiia bacterium]